MVASAGRPEPVRLPAGSRPRALTSGSGRLPEAEAEARSCPCPGGDWRLSSAHPRLGPAFPRSKGARLPAVARTHLSLAALSPASPQRVSGAPGAAGQALRPVPEPLV